MRSHYLSHVPQRHVFQMWHPYPPPGAQQLVHGGMSQVPTRLYRPSARTSLQAEGRIVFALYFALLFGIHGHDRYYGSTHMRMFLLFGMWNTTEQEQEQEEALYNKNRHIVVVNSSSSIVIVIVIVVANNMDASRSDTGRFGICLSTIHRLIS